MIAICLAVFILEKIQIRKSANFQYFGFFILRFFEPVCQLSPEWQNCGMNDLNHSLISAKKPFKLLYSMIRGMRSLKCNENLIGAIYDPMGKLGLTSGYQNWQKRLKTA